MQIMSCINYRLILSFHNISQQVNKLVFIGQIKICLLYTSDAADDYLTV